MAAGHSEWNSCKPRTAPKLAKLVFENEQLELEFQRPVVKDKQMMGRAWAPAACEKCS